MAEIWEKEYLTLTAELLGTLTGSGSIREVYVTETGDRPALVMIPALPSEGFEQVQFRFTVEHILEGTDQLQLMIS
ncbi:MAG: hypothetical protein IJF67_06735, partial [Clostridia bacterium]|nr:hypothetical protein [Clostridia bacterium]